MVSPRILWYPLAFLVEALVLWWLPGIPRSSVPAAKPGTTALYGNLIDIGLRVLPGVVPLVFLPSGGREPEARISGLDVRHTRRSVC